MTRLKKLYSLFFFLVLTACAADIATSPVNVQLTEAIPLSRPAAIGQGLQVGDVMVGLSFSGGGTRAAAFAHGVMSQLAATPISVQGEQQNLLQQVRFVSGVSGGAVAAAYFGYRGPGAVNDFREQFLIKNAEERLRTSFRPANLIRGLEGGVNDSSLFSDWLNEQVFSGATFEQLNRPGRPRVFINATDLFNRVPFIFSPAIFNSFCSDLNSYPLASAVAASAAVPLVFTPVVIRTFPDSCNAPMPDWMTEARDDPGAPAVQRRISAAVARYRAGDTPFIKLVDGGVTDNLGLQGFLLVRLSSSTPFGPMTEQNAVRIGELVIFVVNAGRGPSGDWDQTISGPSGREMLAAVTDSMIDATSQNSLDALRLAMSDWQRDLINYRCRLSSARVRELRGSLTGWNCRDLKIRITEISFQALDPAMKEAMEKVETRFTLPVEQVDLTIRAGRLALMRNPVYQALQAEYGPGG